MRYLEKTFALPAGNPRTSQKDWDRAFMGAREFEDKYHVHDACEDCGDVIWQLADGTWSHYPREGDASPCWPAQPRKDGPQHE